MIGTEMEEPDGRVPSPSDESRGMDDGVFGTNVFGIVILEEDVSITDDDDDDDPLGGASAKKCGWLHKPRRLVMLPTWPALLRSNVALTISPPKSSEGSEVRETLREGTGGATLTDKDLSGAYAGLSKCSRFW
jgi:hypothetical protein